MAVYRSRNRSLGNVGLTIRLDVNGVVSSFVQSAPMELAADPGVIYSGKTRYEELNDYKCSPGEPRSFHACYHFRGMGNRTTNTKLYKFSDVNPAWVDVRQTEEIPNYYYRSSSYGTLQSQCNYAALCDTLSQRLSGLTSSTSLLPVSFLELGKTIKMIRNPFGLLKANWRKIAGHHTPSQLAKAGANVWLEGHYGWNACYQDLRSINSVGRELTAPPSSTLGDALDQRYGASQTVSDGPFAPVYMTESGAVVERRLSRYGVNSPFTAVGGPNAICSKTECTGRSVTFRLGCRQINGIARRFDRTYRALHAFGMTLPQVADVLWEITPFSFVVDWFVDPLGLWKLPSSLARLNATDVRDLHYSVKGQMQGKVRLLLGGYTFLLASHYGLTPSFTDESANCGEIPISSTFYQRTAGLPSLPTMITSLKGSGLSASKGISGISLMIQRLLK